MDDHQIRMMQLAREGFTCSQIMVQMALDMRGEENIDLVRAMAGPSYGCGTGRGTCGALVGGCCVLALYAAKGSADETESDMFLPMMQELTDWFSQHVGEHYGGIACESITGKDGAARSMAGCGQIVADTFARTVEILTENGCDLL